jgi:death-on-curing protein
MHAELIAEHGGLQGSARSSQLDSALARPQHLWHYAASPTRVAASYGHALAKGHCFPDGNTRVALAVMDVFLQMNGQEIRADEAEMAVMIESLASGDLSEDELAIWLAEHVAEITG